MSEDANARAEKIRAVLRETFGDRIDESTAKEIAERAQRKEPVFHPRKPFPEKR